MQRFIAFLLRQRWFVVAATAAALHRRLGRLDAAADRRLPRRHERPGHGPDRGRRALRGRRRAAGHLPDRAADGRRAAGDPGPLALQGRPLPGDRRLRGRHRHLLRAPAGLRAASRGRRSSSRPAWSRSWGRSAPASARSSSTRSRARRSRRWSCAASRTSSSRRSCGRSPGSTRSTASAASSSSTTCSCSPDALLKYDLGLRDVVEALERNNANAAAGFIVRGWEQTYIRGLGQLDGVDDIREVVLKVAEGTPVHVHDVADVVVGPQPRQGAVSRDGKGEAVAGMVIMLRGANSKDVVTRVKETVPRIAEEPAAGGRPQRLLRPHLPDRGLHQDRRRRPARGRHLRDPGPLPLRRGAAHRADRRRRRCRSPSSRPS